MSVINWVFVDEVGTELNKYEMEIVSNGSKQDIKLLRKATITTQGTPLNAAKLNALITAINAAALNTDLSTHIADAVKHITEAERKSWNNRVVANTSITAATKTKITYDIKGLVTGGADLEASDIPDLGAAKINSGTFASARIPSLAASKITSGTFDVARIPSLAAGKITSGTFDVARIPSLNASKINAGTFDTARIPELATSKITSGTFEKDRLPTDTVYSEGLNTLLDAKANSDDVINLTEDQIIDGTKRFKDLRFRGSTGIAFANADLSTILGSIRSNSGKLEIIGDFLKNGELTVMSDLDVIDVRDLEGGPTSFNLLPSEIEDKSIKTYFAQLSGAGSSYRSLINVKGWTANYGNWQLIGPAGTTADDDLYFRSGAGSSWRTPRKIFHTGNLDYSNLPGTKPPVDAQKNSDITKAEIEAKLTGNITKHTHSQYLLTTGKAADSSMLNGLELNSTTTNNEKNKVMRTDASGYANFGWIKMQSGNTTDPVTDVYVNIDGWIYKKTLPLFKDELFSTPTKIAYNTGVMLGFGSSQGEVYMRTSSGKLVLQNDGMSNYSPIATESWVSSQNFLKSADVPLGNYWEKSKLSFSRSGSTLTITRS